MTLFFPRPLCFFLLLWPLLASAAETSTTPEETETTVPPPIQLIAELKENEKALAVNKGLSVDQVRAKAVAEGAEARQARSIEEVDAEKRARQARIKRNNARWVKPEADAQKFLNQIAPPGRIKGKALAKSGVDELRAARLAELQAKREELMQKMAREQKLLKFGERNFVVSRRARRPSEEGNSDEVARSEADESTGGDVSSEVTGGTMGEHSSDSEEHRLRLSVLREQRERLRDEREALIQERGGNTESNFGSVRASLTWDNTDKGGSFDLDLYLTAPNMESGEQCYHGNKGWTINESGCGEKCYYDKWVLDVDHMMRKRVAVENIAWTVADWNAAEAYGKIADLETPEVVETAFAEAVEAVDTAPLPPAGRYEIIVKNYNNAVGATEKAYTLAVVCDGRPVTVYSDASQLEPANSVADEPVTGTLSENGPGTYKINEDGSRDQTGPFNKNFHTYYFSYDPQIARQMRVQALETARNFAAVDSELAALEAEEALL